MIFKTNISCLTLLLLSYSCYIILSRMNNDNVYFNILGPIETDDTKALPVMVQCKKCGMPLCEKCRSKQQDIKNEDSSNTCLEGGNNQELFFHLDECRLLQNAGFQNIPIQNMKAIQHIYALLAPLRLLIKARTNPGLLDLEVSQGTLC